MRPIKTYYDTYRRNLDIDTYLNKPYLIYGFFLNKRIKIYKNLLIYLNSNSICLSNE